VATVRFKPNLPVLGPRLGKDLPVVRAALDSGEFDLDGDCLIVAGHRLSSDDVLRERLPVSKGWEVAVDEGVSVELDTRLDDELLREGRVYELIHGVNTMRKEAGLELTDRIRLTLPESDAELLEHSDWIARETLAVSVEANGEEIRIEKAS
jgi:isoleucyl-tRNA synthetase